MSLNVGKEVAALQRMTVKQLRERYAEIFGDGRHPAAVASFRAF
jgi:hypothetical protein